MAGVIYRPENIIKTKNKRGKIISKHCAASALADSQEYMIKSVFVAVSLLRVVTPPTPIAESRVGAVGTTVSMTIAALAPNEPAEPGAIKAVLPALPDRSLIVPPFNTRAAPDCTSRSGVRSPA